MPILALQSVTKDYFTDGQPVRALNNLSLEVSRGEFVALVGRSGCGKSTLLSLAGAMDFPSSGVVLVDGAATASLKDDALAKIRREKVGFIFQSFQLIHTLTVFENVELPLLLAGKKNVREIARERLSWVELEELGARYPHQLSGGQMQRAAIARALVQSPGILLADEPTGNLDSRTSVEVMDIFQRLKHERGITIVLITHEQQVAEYGSRIIAFKDGQILSDRANQRQRMAMGELALLPAG
jgi:ABC-type lipoprotein export system ATPase subunit